MIPNDTALPEGRTLNGRYRIWQKLGGGGFGLTYLATVRDAPVQGGLVVIKEHFPAWCATRHPTTGQVCVKEGEQTKYDWSLDAFKHEAQQLSILNHPNIIRVTDAFEENNTAYYVMPYVRGGSLADGVKWLRRKGQRLSQAAVLKLMRSLLSALEHMHHSTLRGVPVYHLDIKPGNILLSSNGVEELPVLIDFGSPEMGSPGFMPHEQRTPSAIGPWTDLYALAASIHKLLTGRTPASHLNEQCEALTSPPPQAPLAQNQELLACYDVELLESIDRALSWEPSRRFSDAAQWLRILDSIPLRLPDKGVDLLRLMLNIRTNELVAPVSLWETEKSDTRSSRQEWMRNLAIFLATAGAVSLLGVALIPGGDEETEPVVYSPEPENTLPGREPEQQEQLEHQQREQAEQERRQKEQAEQERRQKEQAEQERRQKEQAEQERRQKEQAEQERRQKEQAEQERRQKEQAEQEHRQKEQAEQERRQKEQAEQERRQKEQAEQERRQKEQAEQESRQKEQAEQERRQKERAEQERRQKEQAERERKRKEQAERERKQREQAEQERKRQEQLRKQREEQRRQSTVKPSRGKHVCPSLREIKAAKPGRPAYERLKEGARQGCPSCSRWLHAVNNR